MRWFLTSSPDGATYPLTALLITKPRKPAPDGTSGKIRYLWGLTKARKHGSKPVMHSALQLDRSLHRRLVDGLYVEAMLMADEARAYFDGRDGVEQDVTEPLRRVVFALRIAQGDDAADACHRLAIEPAGPGSGGEIDDMDLTDEKYRLGRAGATDPIHAEDFPFAARALIAGSQDLYDRVSRLQDRMGP